MAGPLAAQTLDRNPEPTVKAVDDIGTDLRTGKPNMELGRLTIGDASNPTFSYPIMATSFIGGGTPVTSTAEKLCYSYNGFPGCVYSAYRFNMGDAAEDYLISPTSTHVPTGYTEQGSRVSGLSITRRNGEVWNFTNGGEYTYNPGANPVSVVSSIIKPDGEVLTYNYVARNLVSIVSTRGYMMHFEGNTDISRGMHAPTKVVLINLAVDYCGATDITCSSLTRSWPSVTFSNWNGPSVNATDNIGRISSRSVTVTRQGNGEDLFQADLLSATGRKFSYSVNSSVYYVPGTSNPQVVRNINTLREVSNGAGRFTYTFPRQGGGAITGGSSTGPDGVVQKWDGGYVDGREQKTAISIDSYGHIFGTIERSATDITNPEGDKITYTRDFRGNKTQVTKVSKDDSSSLVAKFYYPSSCTDENYKFCNKPSYSEDARGSRTDYEYSADHGGILTETSPANASGLRSQKRYTYDKLFASYRTNAGLLTSSSPIWRLTKTSQCISNISCIGTADEIVESYTYNGNLLLASKIVSDGTGKVLQRKMTGYDAVGNAVIVDGPNVGVDTSYLFYDDARQLVGEIGPDPDGAGALPRRAKRIVYDLDGRIQRSESGSVTGVTKQDLDAMNADIRTDNTYDLAGRVIRTAIQSSLGTTSVVDTSYDARNRVVCSTTRMNIPSALQMASIDACAKTIDGPAGPDRITRNVYDRAGNVLEVQNAVGTPLQQIYSAYTYSPNSKRTSVTDANGNRAEMRYDGFDRQTAWYFPSKTSIGTASTDDYEAYEYDANGNRTSLRRRDGRMLTFGYDALDRVVSKAVPDGCAPIQAGGCPDISATRDVFYGYDLRGLQTYARFDSSQGEGVTNIYNGLGSLISSTTAMAGTSRTVSAEYDVRGNRTQLMTPRGTWTYTYDGLDRLNGLYEGVGIGTVMSSWTYNARGLLQGASERFGSGAGWSYDSAGRMTGQSDNFAGGTGNVAAAFEYNPAGQIVSRSRNNEAYNFTGQYAVDRSYGVNGLNQYTSAGMAGFSYDANGNLIGDGNTSYIYDAENRLVRAGETNLSYDPLGRLFQVASAAGATQFLYDGDQLTAEFDGSGALTNAYVHGPGNDDPLLWYPANNAARWYHRDHQGSIVATASGPSGTLVGINTYDEYGIPGSGNTGRFQYTGQVWLPELGMYHYKARTYSPTLGRFLQTDPIGYDDQANLYAYVANDPVNKTDPSGMCPVCLVPLIAPEIAAGIGATATLIGAYILGPPQPLEVRRQDNDRIPASDRQVSRGDNGGPRDPESKVSAPGPLKQSSEVGDRVRTPDNSRDSFTPLKGGQGFRDNKTGTIMQRSNTNHSNSLGGEIKAGVRPGQAPSPNSKVTISGGREGGCIIKKDGC